MGHKNDDTTPAKDQAGVKRLRAELEGSAKAERETKPFVAHGGKPPAPPRKS
jgi:hypothetical protein